MTETGRIARHGGTVLVGQLATIAFGVTDTVVAGRHADTALAALSVGAAIYISVYVSLIGALQTTLPVWAELNGARQHERIGYSARQSLYACAVAAAIGMTVLFMPGPLLHGSSVPDALRGDITAYLAVLALALPAALLFRLYAALNQALGKPRLVTWLQVGGLGFKIPLSIWFVSGGAGLAPQGVVGCALATLAVNLGMLAVAVVLLRRKPLYRPYALWRPMEPPDGPHLANFARLGIPAGLGILVEVTSFTLMALFIARLGAVAAASHQIAASLASVLYMVPLSLGIATSARVSHAIGAGDRAAVRAAISSGFRLAVSAAVVFSALLMVANQTIGRLYSANPEVVRLAAQLLVWVALYHLADVVQALCLFVLRCYRVTLAPLVIYSVLLWGLGLAGGFRLAYLGLGGLEALQHPVAFWMSSTAALSLTAVAFVLLLRRTVRRSEAAQAATAS